MLELSPQFLRRTRQAWHTAAATSGVHWSGCRLRHSTWHALTMVHRIHGNASREPAAWAEVASVAGDLLQEVLYAKAEGIAKITINRPAQAQRLHPADRCSSDVSYHPASQVLTGVCKQCRSLAAAARMRAMTLGWALSS